jgi:hypothetical protein
MQFLQRAISFSDGIFKQFETTTVVGLAIQVNVDDEPLSIPNNIFMTSFASGMLVPHVLGLGCRPKVTDPIMMLDSVLVVYTLRRPLAVYIEPRKLVRSIKHPVDPNNDVARSILAARLDAQNSAFAGFPYPNKITRRWVVIKHVLQPAVRKPFNVVRQLLN